MNKAENVIKYYVLCNKLKDLIRTGWKKWNVKRNRLESVAEHVYGVQMLAIAIKSEYEYDIDIMKVVMMLAVHELEEIEIGDLTEFEIEKKQKIKKGHKAVEKILSELIERKQILELIYEFDERKTKEALFAHYCDKLECDLQSKLYDEENCVDLSEQENNELYNNPRVQELTKTDMSWGQMWLTFGQNNYNYDNNFKEISDYALNNKISKFK